MSTPMIPKLPYGPTSEAAAQCIAWLEGRFLPWNHPLRHDAEAAVREYNWYCQTHLASDNNQKLEEMFLEFLRSHWPAA
jgi:hypothetical protein